MLGNLDAAAGDALQSFSDALAQAQHTLQQDQTRLRNTAELLRRLSTDNADVRARTVLNTQELQRLDALRSERAKLTAQTGHKREHVESCLAHIQLLKQPRLSLMAAVERQRQEVTALRKQYCIRAAQVHAYVAQFLAPQNSLSNLQQQHMHLQAQRKEGEGAVKQLREKLEGLQREASTLHAEVGPPVQLDEEQGGSEEVCCVGAQKNEGDPNSHPSSHAEEDVNAAGTTNFAEAEEAERLSMARAEQQVAYAAAQALWAEEATRLQQRRAELRQRVLLLCGDIESADAAQQEEQKAYHDALNEAVSGGPARACARCHGDLLVELA